MNNSGKILARSAGFQFIKTAQAATLDSVLPEPSASVAEGPSFLTAKNIYFIALALFGAFVLVVIVLGVRSKREDEPTRRGLVRVAANRTARVAAIGAGLSAIIGARMAGASRIIGIDINESKFALAQKLGATDVINPQHFAKPIQDVIVKVNAQGSPVRVRDVGTVTDSSDIQTNIVRTDGRRSVLMSIYKTGSASTLDIVSRVQATMRRAAALGVSACA